jgi:hypothetical protein
MLLFQIEIDKFEEEIDSYTRGHITLQGRHKTISSKISKSKTFTLFDHGIATSLSAQFTG